MGNPNTHLIDAVRAFTYVVVIDYNRTPLRRGAGSGYFLHATTAGKPTRGCISMPQPDVVAILRWLDHAAHLRILISMR